MRQKCREESKKLAFEVNGEENVGSQLCLWMCDIQGRKQYGAYNLVQELRLDDARFAACFRLDSFVLLSYNSLCSETSSPFFLLWKRLATLIIGQLSKRHLA